MHILEIRHTPGTFCRLLINDVQVYARQVDYNACPRTPISHVLGPGENRVRLDVADAPRSPLQPNGGATFTSLVLRDDGGKMDDEVTLHQTRFPDLYEAYPAEERTLPFRHEEKFLMPVDQLEPVWWRSAPEVFPPEGSPEQRLVVQRLFDAFEKKDVDGFLSATQAKVEQHRRTYGVQAETTPAAARAKVGTMLSQPWDMRPLDMKELVFDRRGDGRVAQVTHRDGSPALFARHGADRTQSWGANLWLARVEGQWSVIW